MDLWNWQHYQYYKLNECTGHCIVTLAHKVYREMLLERYQQVYSCNEQISVRWSSVFLHLNQYICSPLVNQWKHWTMNLSFIKWPVVLYKSTLRQRFGVINCIKKCCYILHVTLIIISLSIGDGVHTHENLHSVYYMSAILCILFKSISLLSHWLS